VYQTAVTSFYQACKPDVLTEELLKGGGPYQGRYRRTKDVLEYVRRIMGRQQDDSGNFDGARVKADMLIDEAIVAQSNGKGYSIDTKGQEINLSSIDLEKLQERFKARPHKNLAITDMVAFLRDRTQQLLNRNVNRVDLAQRLHDEHVRNGEMERDRLITEAQENASRMVREAEEKQQQTLGSLEQERALLERKIDELRGFERDYRSRLKSYLENQLRDLDNKGQVVPGRTPGASRSLANDDAAAAGGFPFGGQN